MPTRRALLVATAVLGGGLGVIRPGNAASNSSALTRHIMVGEVTTTSALVQFRLREGGAGRLEVSTHADKRVAAFTETRQARTEHDYIVRFELTGLKPDTRYRLRALVADGAFVSSAQFKTLADADVASDIHIVAIGCLNYSAFYTKPRKGYSLYEGADAALGFPGLAVAAERKPDYLFCLGDNVYYDTEPKAQNVAQMRLKWQEMADLPRYHELFGQVPAYWIKDDHDYRYNDSDPFADMPISHADGVAVFREQVPVVAHGDTQTPTYRRVRFGADLEVWFLENRDYRSANNAPDGPTKTLWGTAQREWLQSTLLDSSARFKIIASPNPIVGPERTTKRDNHVTAKGFKTEGESFLRWLAEHQLVTPQLFIVCADMHYPYHSRHPYGIDELGTGTLTEGNFYPPPPDAKTSDPDRLLHTPYMQWDEVATLLDIRVVDGTSGSGARHLEFRHIDTQGLERYACTFSR